ncbi:MAG: tRNA preQ1(34) S-adenosylmethionine ribosyltransferase-isomerase QueA [Hyphomicrobiales bacterium]|nr:tRNA preQ1(34) S-adenosylmethionine ribosyltransferase-isomerase QueA [Hyphomicrobiales bacterium]
MRVDLFDFDLPEDRIALRPARPRDAARLLTVDPSGNIPLTDHAVLDLPGLLQARDILVFNDTRVMRAQLSGVRHREGNTATISITLLKPLDQSRWQALARPAKRLKAGDRITFGHGGDVCLMGTLAATVEKRGREGEVTLAFDFHEGALEEAIAMLGAMPLPPYIASKRAADEQDIDDYQTLYAKEEGAVAAPTAGLHFTDRLFSALEKEGIERRFVTLHVGPGTFLPVRADDTAEHRMHAERGAVTRATADALNKARAAGGRIVAVGTTALRLLESAVDGEGIIHPFAGETDIFITPGYKFRAVDLLMTNFHLPRSTLFMLVSAFSGLETMKHAYAHAIREGYRFYSYGDACLLKREITDP